jgi:hypothetical protein
MQQEGGALANGEGEKELSQMAIENTLGYARELETIVEKITPGHSRSRQIQLPMYS